MGGVKSTQILSILRAKTDFCVFSKTDSLADTSFLGGWCKKYLKTFNFDIQNIPLTTLSNTTNRFGEISGHERSVSIKNVKTFGEYCRINPFALTRLTSSPTCTVQVFVLFMVNQVRLKRSIWQYSPKVLKFSIETLLSYPDMSPNRLAVFERVIRGIF